MTKERPKEHTDGCEEVGLAHHLSGGRPSRTTPRRPGARVVAYALFVVPLGINEGRLADIAATSVHLGRA